MIQILLLSRRNPNGPWHIRNRHGAYRATDVRSIRAATPRRAAPIPVKNCASSANATASGVPIMISIDMTRTLTRGCVKLFRPTRWL